MANNSDKSVENHQMKGLLLELCPHLSKELLEAGLPDTPEVHIMHFSPIGTGGGIAEEVGLWSFDQLAFHFPLLLYGFKGYVIGYVTIKQQSTVRL